MFVVIFVVYELIKTDNFVTCDYEGDCIDDRGRLIRSVNPWWWYLHLRDNLYYTPVYDNGWIGYHGRPHGRYYGGRRHGGHHGGSRHGGGHRGRRH